MGNISSGGYLATIGFGTVLALVAAGLFFWGVEHGEERCERRYYEAGVRIVNTMRFRGMTDDGQVYTLHSLVFKDGSVVTVNGDYVTFSRQAKHGQGDAVPSQEAK